MKVKEIIERYAENNGFQVLPCDLKIVSGVLRDNQLFGFFAYHESEWNEIAIFRSGGFCIDAYIMGERWVFKTGWDEILLPVINLIGKIRSREGARGKNLEPIGIDTQWMKIHINKSYF